MKNNRLLIIVSIVLVILLMPLLAMLITNEVNWTLSDFMLASALLFVTGLAIDFVLRKVKSRIFRIIISIAILAILVVIWAEFAVGVFG